MSETPDEDRLVWDIFENAWVTYDYWQWVNQRGKYAPQRASQVR